MGALECMLYINSHCCTSTSFYSAQEKKDIEVADLDKEFFQNFPRTFREVFE